MNRSLRLYVLISKHKGWEILSVLPSLLILVLVFIFSCFLFVCLGTILDVSWVLLTISLILIIFFIAGLIKYFCKGLYKFISFRRSLIYASAMIFILGMTADFFLIINFLPICLCNSVLLVLSALFIFQIFSTNFNINRSEEGLFKRNIKFLYIALILFLFMIMSFMDFGPIGGFSFASLHGYKLFPNKRYEINKDGFRGPAPRPDIKHAFRILAMGDSSTFGYAVQDRFSYPRTLERLANMVCKGEPFVEVINAGVPGYKAYNLGIGADELCRKIKPGLALVLVNTITTREQEDYYYLTLTVRTLKHANVPVALATYPMNCPEGRKEIVEQVCRETSVPIIRLNNYFIHAKKDHLILNDNFHPNENGYLLIAQVIFWRLCELGMIPVPERFSCRKLKNDS